MNPLRFLFAALWLSSTLLLAASDLFWVALRHGWHPTSPVRSRWLLRNSRRVSRVLVDRCVTVGAPPGPGLLVCNHVSYVDVLVLGSLAPAVFVAKSEVAHWPVFGWFARACGTLFVNRKLRRDVTRIGAEIRDRLERGFLVVLFPEGTSSDGREVLPFKSSLLEPVQGVPHAVYAAHVSYHRADGSPASRVPYWGEMTLLPHMISLLGQPRVSARVSLHRVDSLPADRKELARHLQSEVARLAATE